MRLSNGVEVVAVTGAEAEDLKSNFLGYSVGLVRAGSCLLLEPYTRWAEDYLKFQFRPSDVVVMTFPKCGTTWMQEVIWTMCHNPDLDNPDANLPLDVRSPFMEFDGIAFGYAKKHGYNPKMVEALSKLAPGASPDEGLYLKMAEHALGRRIIKTHLPFSLLPATLLDTCKVVYVARNPKDALVSYLHHHRLLKIHDYKGTDEQFVKYFCNGQLYNGCYASHIKEVWERRSHPNLHFVHYEDITMNTLKELGALNKFLNTELSYAQLNNVAHHTKFSEMKRRCDLPVDQHPQDENKNDIDNETKRGDNKETGEGSNSLNSNGFTTQFVHVRRRKEASSVKEKQDHGEVTWLPNFLFKWTIGRKNALPKTCLGLVLIMGPEDRKSVRVGNRSGLKKEGSGSEKKTVSNILSEIV